MDDDDDFPQKLAEIHMQHYKAYPHRPMHYEPALIARIVGYIWARQLKGETVEQCSQKLGLSVSRLRRWMGKLAQARSSEPQDFAPAASLLRPVQVTAEMVRVPDGVAEKRYTLRAPGGYQVRGLSLEELVVLLRGLT
ncbi:MAG TPA: hypothetical protein PKI03_34555 [Pseudomonadota bacterium]|nr:hypothetical protein [Pseudomonadota bacterium]